MEQWTDGPVTPAEEGWSAELMDERSGPSRMLFPHLARDRDGQAGWGLEHTTGQADGMSTSRFLLMIGGILLLGFAWVLVGLIALLWLLR